jgi:hypothetical protein
MTKLKLWYVAVTALTHKSVSPTWEQKSALKNSFILL